MLLHGMLETALGATSSQLWDMCLLLQGHLRQLAGQAGVPGSASSFRRPLAQQSHAEHPCMQHCPAGAHSNCHKSSLIMTIAANLTVKCPARILHGGVC